MSAFGKRLIKAAEEAVAIAKGEADPATYRMHTPWVTRPAPKPKRKQSKPPALPEWLLQSWLVSEFNKLEAKGWPISAVGDMNAARRSYQTAMQCKAMGMRSGEPDIRLYGYPQRILFIEVKRPGEKPSPNQVERHALLAELGHTVLVVAPKDEKHARSIALEIATKFCEG